MLKTIIPGMLMAGLSGYIFYGCTHETDEAEAVNNVIYHLIEADNRSDIQLILDSYTDSIEFYPAGKDFIKGISRVKANYEKLLQENKLNISTQIADTRIFGENAIVTGFNKGQRKSLIDSTVAEIDDKYIAILVRNKEGIWKIDKLIWGHNH